MPKKYTLPTTIFENLIKGLANIESDKDRLLDEYFPKPSKERIEFRELLDNYIKQIDYVIRNAGVREKADNSFPFVIINSVVEVEDLENQDICHFRIVPPFHDTESDGVSYLSPVGKTLLLKKVGDNVIIKAPGGVFRYKIKSIKLLFP